MNKVNPLTCMRRERKVTNRNAIFNNVVLGVLQCNSQRFKIQVKELICTVNSVKREAELLLCEYGQSGCFPQGWCLVSTGLEDS